MPKKALDLIKRQQKQIDVLNTNCMSMCQSMPNMAKAERVETIKEFAEKLKVFVIPQKADGYTREIVLKKDIDNLVKEMVGADNAELCRRIENAEPDTESRGKNGKKIDG